MKTMICRNELFAYIWSYMLCYLKSVLKNKISEN